MQKQAKRFSHHKGTHDAKPIAILGDSHASVVSNEFLKRFGGKSSIHLLPTDNRIAMQGGDLTFGTDATNKKACTAEVQNNRMSAITELAASVFVVSSRLQRLLDGPSFDKKEGGIARGSKYEFRARTGERVEDAIAAAIQLQLDRGNDAILVYPVPEVGWRVQEYLFRKTPLRQDQVPDYLQNHPLTTGYAVYRERTRSSFAPLDSIQHPNLHRVYPHEYQIEGRCVTHITEKLFYRDSDHVNQFGARMINDLIMERSG